MKINDFISLCHNNDISEVTVKDGSKTAMDLQNEIATLDNGVTLPPKHPTSIPTKYAIMAGIRITFK